MKNLLLVIKTISVFIYLTQLPGPIEILISLVCDLHEIIRFDEIISKLI